MTRACVEFFNSHCRRISEVTKNTSMTDTGFLCHLSLRDVYSRASVPELSASVYITVV